MPKWTGQKQNYNYYSRLVFFSATLPESSSFIQIVDNMYKSCLDPRYVSRQSKVVTFPARKDTRFCQCLLFCSKYKYFIYSTLLTVKISFPMAETSEKEHLFPSLTMFDGVSMTKMLDHHFGKREGVKSSTYLNMFVGCISLVMTPSKSLTITISELINFTILLILN